MKILVGADMSRDPNSGASGTVHATNQALRSLGCGVDEIWAGDMKRRIDHWNLHFALELPRELEHVVADRCARERYDVVQISQPHAWLAAREHRRRARHGIFVNRSHGLETMADEALARWRHLVGAPGQSLPRAWLSSILQKRLHRHVDMVVEYADGMIVPASEIRDYLVRHHGADPTRIRVAYHGVPKEFLKAPKAPLTGDRLSRLLYVGQFSAIKAPTLLARAAILILGEAPETTFTWVCGRMHHEAVRALFPGSLQDRVKLRDWTSQVELLDLYDSHGIHLSHSVYEGAAKAATEAMARGQVLVGSAVGALKDLIVDREDGFLVEVGDVEAMASSALAVLRSPEWARQIGAAASAKVAGLSWESCATQALDFYRFLAEERGRC